MKKNLTYYGIIWAIALIVFNIAVFVPPIERYGSFWTGYVLITLVFIVQLVCSILFFKDENLGKKFLNMPVMVISFSALIASLIIGGTFMAVPSIPDFLAIIICAVMTGFYAIAIVSAKAGADAVESIDKKVKAQTFFIKSLTVDAQTLISRAQSDETKALANKVYEAVRYSDPMSNETLAGAESAITLKFNEFANAVAGGDNAYAESSANELLILINDRNQKCKLLK